MADTLRQQVRDRAGDCCEYCRMPQDLDVRPFQLDHIRAQKHSGLTTLDNLAFACLPCNSYKGPNAAGFDPLTQSVEPLFNPRKDEWADHFEWDDATLRGKTAVGRTTIDVLRINLAERVEHRAMLIEADVFAG